MPRIAIVQIRLLLILSLFISFSCSWENSAENYNTKDSEGILINYTLTRKLVSGTYTNSKEITNGVIISSPYYSENANTRGRYIREGSKCLIYVSAEVKRVILLDTVMAGGYLCAEPALDWFLLTKLLKNSPNEKTINILNLSKYYVGNQSRNIDSIYVYSSTGYIYPDSIIYIGKNINAGLVNERSFICDVLKITLVDTISEIKLTHIEEFIKRDSIKKCAKTNLSSLQIFVDDTTFKKHN